MDTMVKTRFTHALPPTTHHDDVCTGRSVTQAEGSYGSEVAKAPRSELPNVKMTKPRRSALRACPFCRELFVDDETDVCPDCGIPVRDLGSLPPSPEAEAIAAEERQLLPHMEPLPWSDFSRGRGVLLACAVLGIAAFFLPWASLRQPEVAHWSGLQLAQVKSFYWSSLVAWLVLVPAVLTRRTVMKMVGARLACGMLAAWPALQTATILIGQQTHLVRRGVAFELHWGPGIYATMALSIVAVIAVIRFGGRLDDGPARRGSKGELLN